MAPTTIDRPASGVDRSTTGTLSVLSSERDAEEQEMITISGATIKDIAELVILLIKLSKKIYHFTCATSPEMTEEKMKEEYTQYASMSYFIEGSLELFPSIKDYIKDPWIQVSPVLEEVQVYRVGFHMICFVGRDAVQQLEKVGPGVLGPGPYSNLDLHLHSKKDNSLALLARTWRKFERRKEVIQVIDDAIDLHDLDDTMTSHFPGQPQSYSGQDDRSSVPPGGVSTVPPVDGESTSDYTAPLGGVSGELTTNSTPISTNTWEASEADRGTHSSIISGDSTMDQWGVV
ncbi:hypothetical protein QFC19_006763 [Naganishia cerealis]|uniref:Uncharacterized protein n=1 Tax=Naganishia cerealis TaxID=610337 RepID=A0ACC2VEJ6_9TREE|nr:hypothetical protein QFC19_006763 [Naganishia cerealis]